ncbi:hypothetical protein [Flavobacterium sp.]|uniref:hypothetical protein n=1 Tax=Flavobacterium sp. TaxID=239 RepID=UPI00333F95A4
MEPIKNKYGRPLTFDYAKLYSGLTRSELNGLIDLIQSDFNSFISSEIEVTIPSTKEFIKFYDYWKSKTEELIYRDNITYTLSVVKNRESSPTILAKVKWHYKLNGKVPKSKYTSVHICSLSKYFKDRESVDLKNPTLIYEAENKIWEYLNRVSPIELMKITGELYTL